MARALAFTQFLIISLGVFALHILVKLEGPTASAETTSVLAQYLARHALWLFAVPILYAAIGNAIEKKVNARLIQAVGLILCLLLLVLLGWPLYYHLS